MSKLATIGVLITLTLTATAGSMNSKVHVDTTPLTVASDRPVHIGTIC
jgi:hypothetical protein